MCHTGACRDLGLIRYKNLIPEFNAITGQIDIKFVQSKMIYNIYNDLKCYGFTDSSSEGPFMTSNFLFAYKNKLWELSDCLYVLEIDDYIAKGSGRDSAMGSLAATGGEPAEIRLLKAIVASSNVDLCVGYPIIVTNTEKCEFKVYNEEDIKKILNLNTITRSSKIYKNEMLIE